MTKEKDNLVILDILGCEYTSVEFSKFLEKELTNNSNITFLIGSSNGLSDEIKKQVLGIFTEEIYKSLREA